MLTVHEGLGVRRSWGDRPRGGEGIPRRGWGGRGFSDSHVSV